MTDEYQQYRADQAHAYLERIRKMGDDCAGKRRLVDDARDRADGVKGIDYSAVQVSTSANDDAMAAAVDEIKALVSDYVHALAEFEDERHRADKALMLMEDSIEAKALRLRYLLGWKWERVCTEMDYSWDGMMKMRRRALCDYWDVMPHSERDPRPLARPREYD